MNSVPKLVAFGAVLVVTFGVAAVVGSAVGPISSETAAGHGADAHGADAHGVEQGESATSASPMELPRGLSVAVDGYRLDIESGTPGPIALQSGTPTELAFRVVGRSGDTVTDFDVLHDRRMHLIVLSRNLVDYLHLHPAMDNAGRWSMQLPALAPGSYRVFADFQPTGDENLTLVTDVIVNGAPEPTGFPGPSDVSVLTDGFEVEVSGTPVVGDTDLSFVVRLDGQQIHTEPYLGALGHLVAVRVADLAYLHVHPQEGDEATVTFTGEFPVVGTYRLFFDFQYDGVVRTASFTVLVP